MCAPSRGERPWRTLNEDDGDNDDDDANDGDDDCDNGDDDANPSPPLFSPGLKWKGAAVRECAEYSHHHNHTRQHCPLNICSHID